jgi:hypothetical protein
MNDVIVIKRRRNFEWQLRNPSNELIMRGRERSRAGARYQAYRNLFMLLAAGRQLVDLPPTEAAPSVGQPTQEQAERDRPETGASDLRLSSAQPNTDQSR